jgi:hypothetical protein
MVFFLPNIYIPKLSYMVFMDGYPGSADELIAGIGRALEILDRNYGIKPSQALSIAESRKDAGIPVSIFNSKLGALESIVKYMREDLLLSYANIGKLLGRNAGPIGVTYRRAVLKMPGKLDSSSEIILPFSILGNDKLSVLECISSYLVKQGKDWHEIAKIMHRHDKTIWTVLDGQGGR